MGVERFKATECLFQPALIGIESKNISDLIYNSVDHCEIDLKKDLYNSILISGGSSMFSGLANRLKSEIQKLVPDSLDINIISSNDRKYSSWIGGSIFTSLDTFKDIYITSKDYYEYGSSVVHKI
jgi:actin-related protein